MSLEQFIEAEENAWSSGVLPAPVGMESPKAKKKRFEHFTHAISEQLYYLGYQDRPSKREKNIVRALNIFQDEVGLPRGNSFSQKLLKTLHKMTSFDDPIPEAYVAAGLDLLKNKTVRYRLAAIKLCAYGFLEKQFPVKIKLNRNKSSPFELVERAIDKFTEVLIRLGADVGTNSDTLEIDKFGLVYNHNHIIRILAGIKPKIRRIDMDFSGHSDGIKAKQEATTFLQNVMEVELWLTGYLVHPFNSLKGSQNTNPSLVAEAISDFWLAQPKEVRPAKFSLRANPGAFFRRIAKIRRLLDQPDVKSREDSNQRQVLFHKNLDQIKEVPKELAKLKENVKVSLLGRIWGGIKKAWRTIKGFFMKIFKVTKRVLKLIVRNVTRIISKIVSDVYNSVRKLIKVFKEGLALALSSAPKFIEKVKFLKIVKKFDGDVNSFIPSASDPTLVKLIFEHMSLAASAFANSSGLMIKLISTFIKAASMNWFSLIISIVSFGIKWDNYKKQFERLMKIADNLLSVEKNIANVKS